MKFFAVITLCALAIAVHASSDEDKAKFKQVVEECLISSEVDKDLLIKARAHEYTGRDEKLAKLYSCSLSKMGFQNTDGTFNIDAMIEKMHGNIDSETTKKGIKKCAVHDPDVSVHDNALNFAYCFYKAVGKGFTIN